MLSNSRRRSTIRFLNTHGDGSVRLRDLSEEIASSENNVPCQEVTYKQRKRVYTSLYQSHLQKMDRLGIVTYDQNRGIVARTAVTGQFGAYLETISSDGKSGNAPPVGATARCGVMVGTASLASYLAVVFAGVTVGLFVAAICLIILTALLRVVRSQ